MEPKWKPISDDLNGGHLFVTNSERPGQKKSKTQNNEKKKTRI